MDKSVEWLYAAENKTGGIAAWKDAGGWHVSYPEVTGYLLPTMLAWGAGDLAERCADWLLKQQNENGSFNGLDGTPRPFDTSAIIEGLRAMFHASGSVKYLLAVDKAVAWMRGMINPLYGHLKNSPAVDRADIYNLRASAIIENKRELEFWKKAGLYQRENRSHYLSYALEGVLDFGDVDFARPHVEMAYINNPGLIPFHVNAEWQSTHPAFDLCASSQMGILYLLLGLDATKTYKAIKGHIETNGGIFQAPDDRREIAWAVKFWLDFKKLYNNTRQ